MAVHAIDVGQADAFLIEFNCGAVLIDAGVQNKKEDKDNLKNYVRHFFESRRPDLDNTFDLVVISHSHADHIAGVPLLFGDDAEIEIRVENYIDSGYDHGQAGYQPFMRTVAGNSESISAADLVIASGYTSEVIDPIGRCSDGVDPEFQVVWGEWIEDAPNQELENPNHHSLVVRIDFGSASFLFTGDLQTDNALTGNGGLDVMLADYAPDLDIFNVDALKVGHHGADNGITDDWLDAVQPCLAFMGVGRPDNTGFGSAKSHGHPRRSAMITLNQRVSGRRPRRDVWTYEGKGQDPVRTQVQSAIFGTSWDKNFTIFASSDDQWSVETQRGESISLNCP